ncbi:5243_t:CDS:1 [Racocetra persica]|uniref:5243_t:CDS:1 n=1 Tax=Racocetra persica TaxID=160502 RepID=A0ACA9KQM9_9GLOM|nr:5243_t:CDS:1 [Racocetra persica]
MFDKILNRQFAAIFIILIINYDGASEIRNDLSNYGNLISIQQCDDDGKLLMTTSTPKNPFLLSVLYQNESVVYYKDAVKLINLSIYSIDNIMPLVNLSIYSIDKIIPLTENKLLLIYYDRNDPKNNVTMLGPL